MTLNSENARAAYLILANGTVFKGKGFGKEGEIIGEIVFTTAMTGYQETLSDPSYCGQIVTQTFPLIGNYGVNEEDYESGGSVVAGYVVREHCEEPSNFRSTGTIDGFLKKHGIIGIYGIDTRRLTRIIREVGVMNGMITDKEPTDDIISDVLERINAFRADAPVPKVSVKAKEVFSAQSGKYKVALIDYGSKVHIRKELVDRSCDVTVFPHDVSAQEILDFAPDGIMLSNGPGDPQQNPVSIETLKALIPHKIPTFGICLGHQLFAIANGAETVKLKYGHRGENQPVTELETGKTYITSQNHGYAVVSDSLPEAAGHVSHINANDKTCEGIKYTGMPAFTVQFHPEACGGPLDTAYLFDRFIELMENKA